MQTGTYTKLIAFLNELRADNVVLELTRRPAQEPGIRGEVRPTLAQAVERRITCVTVGRARSAGGQAGKCPE